MSERGGPVHSYTVRAHHHDGSGGSERAAPNRDTPLAWRVQGVAPNEGNGQGKDRAFRVAAGVGPSITHELGLGQGRLAPLRKTRLGACRTYTSGLNMAKAMGAPRLHVGFTPNTGQRAAACFYCMCVKLTQIT